MILCENKQEKNEKLVTQLAQMEKKLVTAETTLEATLQYESGQNKALSSSPRYIIRTHLLFFSLAAFDLYRFLQNLPIYQKQNLALPLHMFWI